ncbi:WD40 repeat-like protein [Dentipellis sp. KUC8613]|nr:WD40 repeat-like protein [Dentipellis sp. KUC8613]
MSNIDSDDDADFDNDDGPDDIDEDILDAIEAGAEDSNEDQDSDEDESDDAEDDDQDDEEGAAAISGATQVIPAKRPSPSPPDIPLSAKVPTPPTRTRSLSPAHTRRSLLRPAVPYPKSYTVEAICALPHPVPTHALAATPCMSHILTGSDDGYVRDYDIFAAVNGKVFLTAPQRHHAGVVEGILKAGQIRSWWENPGNRNNIGDPELAPVHSLAIHGDALWGLAGSNTGNINLYTLRHEPGRIFHSMDAHRGPVSALCLQHDEKGFFSAGWDGNALQWDLNTGQIVRRFRTHGAQLAAIQVRPVTTNFPNMPAGVNASVNLQSDMFTSSAVSEFMATDAASSDLATYTSQDTSTMATSTTLDDTPSLNSQTQKAQAAGDSVPAAPSAAKESDAKSDTSYDPLFDDEPDAEGEPDTSPPSPLNQAGTEFGAGGSNALHLPTSGPASTPFGSTPAAKAPTAAAPAPKNAPPVLDSVSYATFSPDIMLTAAMDGQVILWDCRVADPSPGHGVGRLWMSEKTPPWCLSACWSMNGACIYAGRRNGTIDVWDVRQLGRSGPSETPRLLKTLRNPISSGVVSCVAAFPDGRHIACASNDNIRLWNAAEAGEGDVKGRVQFKIIPGHHGGIISQMLIDPAARFLVSASGNRGWHGDATRTVFVHDIKPIV